VDFPGVVWRYGTDRSVCLDTIRRGAPVDVAFDVRHEAAAAASS
jgi:hypothetical protein